MTMVGEDIALVSKTLDDERNKQRREIFFILFINWMVGLNWLIASPKQTRSETYDLAKEIISFVPFYEMRLAGGIFIALAALGSVGYFWHKFKLVKWAMRGMCVYWGFWLACSLLAFGMSEVSIIGSALFLQGTRRYFMLAQVRPWVIRER